MDGALARLYGATFLYALAMALGVPLVPQFLQLDFGSSLAFIGAVMAVYGLMQILLRLPMGDMADRKGRRRSLLLAFGFTALSGLLLVVAPNPWWVVPAIGAFGFAGGVFWVAANSYLFDRAEAVNEPVGKATSDYAFAAGAAFLAGPVIGGVLADLFGFRAAFAAFLVCGVLGAALVLTLPEAPRAARPAPTTSVYRRAWGLLRSRALVLSGWGAFLYSALFATMTTVFPVYIQDARISVVYFGFGFAPVAFVGLLLSGRQAAATAVRFGLPRLLAWAGPRRVLFGSVFAGAVAFAMLPLAQSPDGLWFGMLVFGASTGLMIPANLMLVHEGAPPDERGLANGIYGTMLGIGSTVAPLGFAWIGDLFGITWAFYGAAATIGGGTLALMVYDQMPERDAANPTATG